MGRAPDAVMKMRARCLGLLLLAVAGVCVGCGSDERKITPDEEKMYRDPPKSPPAGYKGNDMGAAPAPPSGGTGG